MQKLWREIESNANLVASIKRGDTEELEEILRRKPYKLTVQGMRDVSQGLNKIFEPPEASGVKLDEMHHQRRNVAGLFLLHYQLKKMFPEPMTGERKILETVMKNKWNHVEDVESQRALNELLPKAKTEKKLNALIKTKLALNKVFRGFGQEHEDRVACDQWAHGALSLDDLRLVLENRLKTASKPA